MVGTDTSWNYYFSVYFATGNFIQYVSHSLTLRRDIEPKKLDLDIFNHFLYETNRIRHEFQIRQEYSWPTQKVNQHRLQVYNFRRCYWNISIINCILHSVYVIILVMKILLDRGTLWTSELQGDFWMCCFVFSFQDSSQDDGLWHCVCHGNVWQCTWIAGNVWSL